MEEDERQERMMLVYEGIKDFITSKYGKEEAETVAVSLSLLYASTAVAAAFSRVYVVDMVLHAYELALEQ